MADSPVAWLPDGTPHCPRFGDIYRSRGTDALGPWAQAREVFLRGCGLLADSQTPARWARQRQWHMLETGFGLGLNFLAAWHAWRADPDRPQRLFFSSIEAWPVSAEDLRRSAAPFEALRPLADELARQWKGLLPGTHRLVLDDEQVHLTLYVADVERALPLIDTPADSVLLDGFSPRSNPQMWSPAVIKAIARLCRPGTGLATWTVARSVRDALQQHGFRVCKAPGLPPKRHRLEAVFEPRWPVGRAWRAAHHAAPPGRAVIVGAGLAGSAAAWSLARRGWTVEVLDAAAAPAAGASGLPAGLIAPHVSPDDAPLSRLSRAGVRATLQRAHALLDHGKDWAPTGVLEHRVEGKRALPLAADDETALWMADWTAPADIQRTVPSALPPQAQALWHACGAWIRPARLVRMQLSHPGIRWRGGCPLGTAERTAAGWRLLDANGSPLAEADVLILACAYATRALLAQVTGAEATLPAHPLHGQVSWGPMSAVPAAANCLLPPWPVNGHGSFLHGIPGDGGQPFWILGSTFDRGQTQPTVSPEGHRANLARLQRLLPALGEAMAPAIEQAQGWAAVRCTLPDRMPAIGAIDPGRWSGLYVFTGLGARGLTLSVLGGECLAAQLHGEPWPVEPALAKALQASRFMR